MTGIIRSKDIENMHRVANEDWCGDAIVYSHRGGDIVYLPQNSSVPITLNAREYEVFTIIPVKKLSRGDTFAAIGLINMFNSGGAIKELKYESEKDESVSLKVRGCGMFGAYASVGPRRITADANDIEFDYEEKSGFITFTLTEPVQGSYHWDVIVIF